MPGPDATAVAAAKRLLRKAIRLRRDARPADRRRADDLARTERVQAFIGAARPSTVALYVSAGTEPATLALIAWLAALRCRVLLPVLTEEDAQWRTDVAWADYAGPDALRAGRAGIVEPTGPALPGSTVAEADLVICPGLAASPAGDRLGRGGGWYDQALAFTDAPVCLLLNDDEVLDVVPTATWDRPVDVVITPRRTVECRPERG